MTAPPTAASPPDRRDRLPGWVIGLLAVFLLLRVLDLHGDSVSARTRSAASTAGRVDEKTMSATLIAGMQAKTAYLSTFGKPGSPAPDPAGLREALKSAEALQRGTQNSPGAARRVLILRALLHLPLFGPSQVSGPARAGKSPRQIAPDPAQAFLPAALAALTPAEKARYAAEGRLWADIARGPHLTPAQTAAGAALLRSTPNIRWWLSPALSVLYASQGNPRLAGHFTETARRQALLTAGPLTVLFLFWILLGVVGTGLLLALLARRFQKETSGGGPAQFWPTVRETVPLDERRLRAGDLMGVFVLYLLMPDILGWLIAGFHLPHGVHYAGLLGPYRAHFLAQPVEIRVAANVVLEFFAYLLGAAVPIAVLVGIARRNRASISEELGWNTHRLGWNLLYGVGGYAIALPLLYLGQRIGVHIPGPTPSNPAIPLLADAGSIWVQALLVGLATIAAPLCEELLFRGVFYNAAKLKVGVWPAIILTGLIFGFVHPVGLSSMLPLAVLGGVFAWMAETRKSLVPSMLGHFMQNGMATAMLLLALAG